MGGAQKVNKVVKKTTKKKTKKKAIKKDIGGRPTKYSKEFDEQARKLAMLGLIDTEIADFFVINIATLYRWKNSHKSFCDALKAGKLIPDAEVAISLFERATGYEHPEDKIFQFEGQPVIVPTTKHYPPDATSMIFWLKNRQPGYWREKPEGGGGIEDIAQALNNLAHALPS